MKVETIILQHCSSSSSFSSRPYVAVGVIARNSLTLQRFFFEPQGGGEIVISSGALSSPQLLSSSIILPVDYPLHSLREQIETRSFEPFPPAPLSAAPPPASSPPSGPQLFSLPDIGRSLLDHTILPYICFANWWDPQGGHQLPFPTASDSQHTDRYPPNSVHGWVSLNESGELYDPLNDPSPPKCVTFPHCPHLLSEFNSCSLTDVFSADLCSLR
jgi:hypothetical protein